MPLLGRRGHQPAHGVEDDLELGIVLLFQGFQLAGQFGVRRHDLPKPHERPHDLDVHPDRRRAAEHAGEHRHALLGEGVGRISPPAPGT